MIYRTVFALLAILCCLDSTNGLRGGQNGLAKGGRAQNRRQVKWASGEPTEKQNNVSGGSASRKPTKISSGFQLAKGKRGRGDDEEPLELDDPEELAAANEKGGDDEAKETGKGNDESSDSEEEEDSVATPEPTWEATTQDHDVTDLEEAIPMSPQSTAERILPPVTMAYKLQSYNRKDLDDGDYYELYINTEEHLNRFFGDYFLDSPAQYIDSDIQLYQTENEFVIEYQIKSLFHIPGNVPTFAFMLSRIKEAFEGTEAQLYLQLLQQMDEENPFHKTVGVEIVYEQPDGSFEPVGPDSDNEFSLLIPLLAGASVLIFIAWLAMLGRRLRNGKVGDGKKTPIKGDMENSESGKYSTNTFKNEDETRTYVRTVRSLYRDDVGPKISQTSSTDLEDVSLDDDRKHFQELKVNIKKDPPVEQSSPAVPRNEAVSPQAAPQPEESTVPSTVSEVLKKENKLVTEQPLIEKATSTKTDTETLTELDQAMEALDTLADTLKDIDAPRYPSPPSDGGDPYDVVQEKAINYLELNSSFEEEDLRT